MTKMSDEDCIKYSQFEGDMKSIICTNTPREEQQKTIIGGDSGKFRSWYFTFDLYSSEHFFPRNNAFYLIPYNQVAH